jgi:hypothetical protein
MPIQPLSINSYNAVPDEDEDVSIVDGTNRRKIGKRYKYASLFLILIIAIVFVMYFSAQYPHPLMKSVKLYQTTFPKPFGIQEVNVDGLATIGTKVTFINFGNTKCSEKISHLECSLLSETPAKLSINSNIKYQSIIGFGGAFTGFSYFFVCCLFIRYSN